jgi:hypothetical protein
MAEVLVPYAPAAGVFGRTAEITPRDGAPVTGTVIVAGREAPPAVGHLGLAPSASVNLRWIVSVPRSLVALLPIGSTILTDLDGEGARVWRVDRVDRLPDEFRVVVS